MSHRRRHRLKIKSLYVWHRYVGLTAALFVILLALSGVTLNHTEQFELDNHYVQNRWLLDWYGIKAPASAVSVTTAHGRTTLLGAKLYFKAKPLEGEFQTLHGAVALNEWVVVAIDQDLLLLTAQGEYVERLSSGDGVPADIQNLGRDTQGHLVITTGTGRYSTDAQLLSWQPWSGSTDSIDWGTPQPFTGAGITQLQVDYLGRILPWERVILDLHSGRLFGASGPWLMDAAAGLMLFLAGSGMFIWWRRQR
ncbi:MAG: PepSY domain-containing protein [Gammaproteobacteria bacterium]|nr:PepSY domain-containing protein [Gammaproteobacteria bacterium]